MVAYAVCVACYLILYKNESGLNGQCKKMKKCPMGPEMRSVSVEYPVMDTRRRENRPCQGDGKSRCVWRRDE